MYGTIVTQKKHNFCCLRHDVQKSVQCSILTPPKIKIVFACGCVKNPGFSQKIFACGGPKLTMPSLPQNMYNQQKNHVFKSDNKMCPYGIILGKKKLKIKNLKKKKTIRAGQNHWDHQIQCFSNIPTKCLVLLDYYLLSKKAKIYRNHWRGALPPPSSEEKKITHCLYL